MTRGVPPERVEGRCGFIQDEQIGIITAQGIGIISCFCPDANLCARYLYDTACLIFVQCPVVDAFLKHAFDLEPKTLFLVIRRDGVQHALTGHECPARNPR